jgi:hypothetical protein
MARRIYSSNSRRTRRRSRSTDRLPRRQSENAEDAVAASSTRAGRNIVRPCRPIPVRTVRTVRRPKCARQKRWSRHRGTAGAARVPVCLTLDTRGRGATRADAHDSYRACASTRSTEGSSSSRARSITRRPTPWRSAVEELGVTGIFTSPTAVRMLMRYGSEPLLSIDHLRPPGSRWSNESRTNAIRQSDRHVFASDERRRHKAGRRSEHSSRMKAMTALRSRTA